MKGVSSVCKRATDSRGEIPMKSQVALALLLIVTTSAYTQDTATPVPADDAQDVTLVVNADGVLVIGNPDGTLGTEGFVVPADHELLVRDIVWFILGEAGADARIGISNTNIDGVSNYIMWQATPTLNATGEAAGTTSFSEGPIITTEGGVSFFGTHPFNLTIYGTVRALPPPEPE